MVTPNANHSLAQFSVTTVEGTLTDLIVKPALVEWQRAGQISGIKLNRKNQNWDEEPSTGWYDDRNNYSKISGYGAWKDDYLWLPSRYEISMLWSANFLSESFWSRTGDENSNLVTLGVGGFDAAYKKYPVFPALHIDLSAPELAANLDEVPDSFGEVVYDGNDHHVAVTKPSWYRNDMQITYTNQKGENVTVVKDAGEYTAEITLGQLTKTTTITIAPQEITGDNNVTARPKTYDRTTNVTLDDSHYTLTGVFPGDNITTKITGAFTDFNVGEQDVNVSVKLDGAAAGNYVLTNPTFTIKATIDPRSVTVSNIAVKAKPYDGTNRAIIDASNATFVAVGFDLSADDLTVAVSGTYDQITVGHDWTVTLNVVLDGATAGNYVLGDGSQKQVEHCAITQREITVTINDQTVKVGDAVNLSARVTSGSLANGDNADDVYTLAIELPADAEYDINNLPAGEYTITGADANTEIAKNYDVKFVNGKYTVLTAEAWDALQTKDDEGKGDNNAWLVIIIVIAVAAFIGALVGIGLVVRSHDRTPKPAKGKSNKIDKATKTDAELTSGKNAQPQAE